MSDVNINKQLEIHGIIPSEQEHATPEELYARLIDKIKQYHPSSELEMIDKAYKFAKEAHKDQKRKSGEPYIIHPLHTALILADLELDKESIMAALLHDVMEDTSVTREDMVEAFGEEVTDLVDGVTKLTKLDYDVDKVEKQAENLRKMFLAMAKDIRVILIKLADRLHNMRTLMYRSPEGQKETSRETIDIYSPIADRLGISKIKIELDDLSLRYLEPEKYDELVEGVHQRLEHREDFMNELIEVVAGYVEKAGIKATIDGRVKHYFSIYKKMVNQHKTLDQIYDIFAVRIIVDSVMECYGALGIIHEKFTPVPGRFKDYIAMPKENMYQSLHTSLIAPNGQPFEIQIRTAEMHRTAEYGIAAHWKYKENLTGDDNEEQKISWLRQILEWQRDMTDNQEFLDLLKDDLNMFSGNVYCFTPDGDLKNLPNGSTPVDFAYSIHSAVGNKMIGAKVNGEMVNIDYEIKNGDRIEILTSNNSSGPSRDWLKIVKSTQTKNKINQWFRSQNKEVNIERGNDLIKAYCKTKSINLEEIMKPKYMDIVRTKYGFKEWDALLATVGHGGLKEGQIVNRLLDQYKKDHDEPITDQQVIDIIDKNAQGQGLISSSKSGVIVEGMDDVAVRFSKCCTPVPGDEIVGFVTRGRGVSLHRTDCVNMINLPEMERNRLIEASWAEDQSSHEGKYNTEIVIYAHNRVGILSDLSKIFTENDIDVLSINSRTSKNEIATITMAFQINSTDELNDIIAKIRQIDSIIDIERTAS
ncbi:MAG: bifunctional (p)ppGpp synthetase/guanosine-3',5'-bis(diphosphate) 3'-pyrophosphohydrolase [Eubacterium sp.]|nr:bifunctional (p)ppGpp synthetase/guanosine-3',5'-bis(diphosphate) 3'-pyrophosphohydrolase [Eubacterium sp.]